MQSQYSHSSRENETPSSSTSLLASCKGVSPPPPRDSAIHWIKYYAKDSALGFCNLLSLWIATYPADSAIQLLNNRGWWIKVKNSSARNLLFTVDLNSSTTASLTVACRTQPHMFSSSIPITPYVLSIPCSQAPTGQKWHLYRGKINEVGLIWDQALLSFRFENYIPVGKAKR